MVQGCYPQEFLQAIRSVDKSIPSNAVPPATPDEIYHVDTHPDAETQKGIVLWDNILQAFDKAVQVRHKTRIIPFLKDKDFTIIQPRRIAAMPDTILDGRGYYSNRPQGRDSSNPTAGSGTIATTNLREHDKATKSSIVTTGVPVEMDIAQTSISASLGDKEAQVALGDMYRDGKGVPQDYLAAMDCYRKAAEQGHVVAQHSIGLLYHKGRGVPQDFARATDWYLKSAEGGHVESQYFVDEFYYFGHGVPLDYNQAMDWFLKAAQRGHATSQFGIGLLYDNGEGFCKDHSQAIEWYLKAANQGHPDSQYIVGMLSNHAQLSDALQ